MDLVGFCGFCGFWRIFEDFKGFGRIREDLQGFGRFWRIGYDFVDFRFLMILEDLEDFERF